LNVWSFLTQIRQHHTQEGRQLFARSSLSLHFFLNRYGAERPASAKDLRRPEAGALSLHIRECSIETQLRFSRLHVWRQSFTTTDYLKSVTKEVMDRIYPRVQSTDGTTASPADPLLSAPELLRARIFSPGFPLSPPQSEISGAIRKQTLETVVEDRLMKRLRKAEAKATPVPAVAFTMPAVQQVWRQGQLPLRGSPGEGRSLPATPSTAADSSTQHKVELLPPAPVVLPAKVEVPSMERIAEDVMKRIERHLRIERERRGM
jgi:hypothetical protein